MGAITDLAIWPNIDGRLFWVSAPWMAGCSGFPPCALSGSLSQVGLGSSGQVTQLLSNDVTLSSPSSASLGLNIPSTGPSSFGFGPGAARAVPFFVPTDFRHVCHRPSPIG